MQLFLSQIIYTSFARSGFQALASQHVPSNIQQAFIQNVVSNRWDSYKPPTLGYRAAYLYQVSPEHTLFGWLYNDGIDDMGRSDVPYFICYYLAEPLFNFQLTNIFTCLARGPIALIDRHSLTPTIETKIVSDFWSYQPARLGVAIPLSVRKCSDYSLERGDLLDIFIPIQEQEMVVVLSSQVSTQPTESHSIYTSYVIEGIGVDTADIDEDVAISPTKTTQLQQSAKELSLTTKVIDVRIQPQSYTKNKIEQRLKLWRQSLIVKHQQIEPIKAWLNQQITPNKPSLTNKAEAAKISSINSERYLLSKNNSLFIDSSTDAHQNLFLAYKRYQLLLKVSITTSIMAVVVAIYGLTQVSSFQTNAQTIWGKSKSFIHKSF